MATTYPTGRKFHGDDLTGHVFGRLCVVRLAPPGRQGKRNRVRWVCRCDCGTEKVVFAEYMKAGRVVSCGCRGVECRRFGGGSKRSHLPEVQRTRGIWRNISDRCHNPQSTNYPGYGGRGIAVCDRWRASFDDFLEDVGVPPSIDHSLDRYPDQNGNYEPGNVRWATTAEQARNKRNNRNLTHDGRTQCLEDWSRELGLAPGALGARLKAGWSVERALTTPNKTQRHRGMTHLEMVKLRELAEAAAKARECDGRVWATFAHTAFGPVTHEVTHRDAADPADLRDSFDVFAGDTSEAVVNYIAALHPSVVLSLLKRL